MLALVQSANIEGRGNGLLVLAILFGLRPFMFKL